MTAARALRPAVPALEKARRLAAVFAETAALHDETATFPFDNFARLATADLLALRTPRQYGGSGAGLREAADVLGAIAKGEPATALVLAMHYIQHAIIARSHRWPAAIKEMLARASVEGVSLINALRVEPDLGSPARGGLPATTAVRCGEAWHLSGHKIYATGAPILSWYTVWAKTDEPAPRVGMFLVRAGGPGIRIVETWNHLGLRASGSHDVHFDGAVIPLDHAVDIRRPEDWTSDDLIQQHRENGVLLSALYHGIAEAARDWLVDFLKHRTPSNLGAPLSSLARVQEAVGTMEIAMATNRRLIHGLADDLDAGKTVPASDAHVVKSVVTTNVIAVVETALTLTGNHGLTRTNPLQRHHRDALCGRVHTPQDDSVRLMLGRAALD